MPRMTLVGYRGTGKSTVGELLARRIGCGWVDADAVLEERAGCTIAALVRDRGEPAFRAAEAALLGELLDRDDVVLATGGGVVLRPDNRRLLADRGRPVVWLQAPAAVIRARLSADPATRDRRPALTGRDPLDEVEAALADREALYRACADLVVDAATDEAATIADRLGAWLERDWSTRRVRPEPRS